MSDAGLGNGGLGRLAACYLDALATQGYPAMIYSITMNTVFLGELEEGWQVERPTTGSLAEMYGLLKRTRGLLMS